MRLTVPRACGTSLTVTERSCGVLWVAVLLVAGVGCVRPAVSAATTLKTTQTLLSIERLADVLEAHHRHTGRYPTTEEGLSALVGSAYSGWSPGYVIPFDAWGRPYRYEHPSSGSGTQYELWSLGRNGIDEHGSGDDISSWAGYDRARYGESREPGPIVASVFALLCVGATAMLVRSLQRRRRARANA